MWTGVRRAEPEGRCHARNASRSDAGGHSALQLRRARRAEVTLSGGVWKDATPRTHGVFKTFGARRPVRKIDSTSENPFENEKPWSYCAFKAFATDSACSLRSPRLRRG
jgi:hypothetical protein